jgi:peptidyl-prolyl cis-trans isomerase C
MMTVLNSPLKAGTMHRLSLRKALCAILGLSISAAVSGISYGQTASHPGPNPASAGTARQSGSPDKVILKVGDQQVTQADMDFIVKGLNAQYQQALATQGRRPLGDQYALMLVLSQEALKQRLDAAPGVARQLALMRLQTLAQAEYEALSRQVKVTPEEVSQNYSAHPEEFDVAQVRQAVVRKKADGAQEASPGLSSTDAKSRAEAIRRSLSSGVDVKKVAEEFQVPNTVMIDVDPRPIHHGEMVAELDKVVFQLKDGQVSEVVDLPQALVIVQVVTHQHQELKEVSTQIENSLRQQKVDAAVAQLKAKTPVWMDDAYFAPAPHPSLGTSAGPQPPTQALPSRN